MADGVLAVVRRVTSWYEARHEDYRSPVGKTLSRDLKLSRKPRQRWLSNEEIKLVWDAAGEMGTFGALVRILRFRGSGWRRSRRWNGRTSTAANGGLARGPREKGTPAALTLPDLAMAVISQRPQIAGNPYVFAGRGSVAIAAFTEYKAALDARLPEDMPRWVLHDLRRTCRALLSRMRVPTDVAELTFGHSLPGVRGIYDNPAEYRQPLTTPWLGWRPRSNGW